MKTEQKSQVLNAIQSPERFKLLEDGWIQDVFLGLDWGSSSDETMNMKDAIKYCTKKGGRLPEIHKLHSLVDFSKEQPATFPILKDTKYDDWYWSGTKTAWNKSASWCVSFSHGDVGYGSEDGVNYARPVRASQSV